MDLANSPRLMEELNLKFEQNSADDDHVRALGNIMDDDFNEAAQNRLVDAQVGAVQRTVHGLAEQRKFINATKLSKNCPRRYSKQGKGLPKNASKVAKFASADLSFWYMIGAAELGLFENTIDSYDTLDEWAAEESWLKRGFKYDDDDDED